MDYITMHFQLSPTATLRKSTHSDHRILGKRVRSIFIKAISVLTSMSVQEDNFNLPSCGFKMGLNGFLGGGLEHEFDFPIYWECHHPN